MGCFLGGFLVTYTSLVRPVGGCLSHDSDLSCAAWWTRLGLRNAGMIGTYWGDFR